MNGLRDESREIASRCDIRSACGGGGGMESQIPNLDRGGKTRGMAVGEESWVGPFIGGGRKDKRHDGRRRGG
jgi:hypothetical protein